MAKLIKKIELEDGDYFELYETGNTYKSIFTQCDGAIKEEKRHINIYAALNSRANKYFEKAKGYENA